MTEAEASFAIHRFLAAVDLGVGDYQGWPVELTFMAAALGGRIRVAAGAGAGKIAPMVGGSPYSREVRAAVLYWMHVPLTSLRTEAVEEENETVQQTVKPRKLGKGRGPAKKKKTEQKVEGDK